MEKMNYNQAIFAANVANAIPIAEGENKLSASTAASVVMTQVSFDQIVEEFEANCQAALKKVKKEGYDERATAIEAMKDVDSRIKAHDEWDGEGEEPAMPTDEEIEKAEETRKTEADFETEHKELLEQYRAIRVKEAKKTVTRKPVLLSREELADIIELIGTEGVISAQGFSKDGKPADIDRRQLIAFVAAYLVKS